MDNEVDPWGVNSDRHGARNKVEVLAQSCCEGNSFGGFIDRQDEVLSVVDDGADASKSSGTVECVPDLAVGECEDVAIASDNEMTVSLNYGGCLLGRERRWCGCVGRLLRFLSFSDNFPPLGSGGSGWFL